MVVKDHHNSTLRYSLDLQSGVVVPDKVDEKIGANGFGQWRTLGLIRGRRRSFSAIFAYGDDIALWLEDGLHVVRVPSFTARIVETLPFVRRFELSGGGGFHYEATYFAMERDPWPTDGDLFSLVSRVVQSGETLRRFWYIWKASGQGRDITTQAFYDETNAWIEKHGS